MIVEVNDNNFDSEVTNSEIPVLVEFGATWCAPCKRQLPILEELSSKPNAKVCSIDIDHSPKLVAKFKIKSVPTLAIFVKGKKVDSRVGLMSLDELQIFVDINN